MDFGIRFTFTIWLKGLIRPFQNVLDIHAPLLVAGSRRRLLVGTSSSLPIQRIKGLLFRIRSLRDLFGLNMARFEIRLLLIKWRLSDTSRLHWLLLHNFPKLQQNLYNCINYQKIEI